MAGAKQLLQQPAIAASRRMAAVTSARGAARGAVRLARHWAASQPVASVEEDAARVLRVLQMVATVEVVATLGQLRCH